MVDYVPPPRDLSRLNPIQRYMQKGSLDWSDYVWLVALVLLYWFCRPALQRFFKTMAGPEVQQGEDEQKAYEQRRAQAAIDANSIRSGQKQQPPPEKGKTLGQILDDGVDGMMPGHATTTSANVVHAEGVSNRTEVKKKKKGVSFAPEKSAEERTLDWEDESQWDPSKTAQVMSHARPGEIQSGNVLDWIKTWDE